MKEIYNRRIVLTTVIYILLRLPAMLVVLNQASVMAGSCIIFNHDLHASTNNMREDVDYSGCSASGLIHASAGYVFPGLHVIITGFEQSHIFTSSYLMKNDLNGQFLINQPGQPFKQDPGNTAGADFNLTGTQ